jgi:hypothetical protein
VNAHEAERGPWASHEDGERVHVAAQRKHGLPGADGRHDALLRHRVLVRDVELI